MTTETQDHADANSQQDNLAGFDVDYEAGAGREVCRRPEHREHEDYKRPRWASCHLEDVDRVYATAARSGGAFVTDDDEPRIRIDLDAVGTSGGSLHEGGENVSLSVWLSPEQVAELVEHFEDARELGRRRVWGDDRGGPNE